MSTAAEAFKPPGLLPPRQIRSALYPGTPLVGAEKILCGCLEAGRANLAGLRSAIQRAYNHA